MKKTLTIHLGRSIYPIDEDAYELLDQYLKDYRASRSAETADAKVAQLEKQIADFFSEKREEGVLVVSMVEVEAVIQLVAQTVADDEAREPESAAEPVADETAEKEAADSETYESSQEEPRPTGETTSQASSSPRKLYRDRNDKMVGGVLSGFARYMGWDATAVRLIFALFAFFDLSIFLVIYVVSWIVIPSSTLSGDGCGDARSECPKEGATPTQESPSHPTFLQRFSHLLAWVIAFLFKILLVVLCICLIPAMLIMTFVLAAFILGSLGVMVSVPAFLYTYLPLTDFSITPLGGSLFTIAGVLIFGIPFIALVYACLRRAKQIGQWSRAVRVTLLLLWLFAWMVAAVGLLIGVTF